MSRITATFARLRAAGRAAFMPYLTLGFPERDSALSLVPALEAAGADLIELGLPFSDPLADGATIQAATQRALANGMTLARCLDQVEALRQGGVTVPLVLMGYYNPILQLGLEPFADRAAAAGVDGVIVPDLPPEESDPLRSLLRDRSIDLVFLLAPTSTGDRLRQVAALSGGFLYLVSLTGVTGARQQMASGLEEWVAQVRSATDLPVAVGFGISTPAQAAEVACYADGVIVGSALIQAIGAARDPRSAAAAFTASLRSAMDHPQA
jgi:tryptophan synthase alpha chain